MPWRVTVKRVGESENEDHHVTFDGAVAEAMRFAIVNCGYAEQSIEHISIDNLDYCEEDESPAE